MKQLSDCIQQLLLQGAVEKCKHSKGELLSQISFLPKHDGSNRFILNLKQLNKFVKTKHFKLKNYVTASRVLYGKSRFTRRLFFRTNS